MLRVPYQSLMQSYRQSLQDDLPAHREMMDVRTPLEAHTGVHHPHDSLENDCIHRGFRHLRQLPISEQ